MTSRAHIALPLVLALGAVVQPSLVGKDELIRKGAAALRAWDGEVPGLEGFAQQSYGYAMFPTVAKGGLGVGAAYGRGVVYEQDQHVGFADLSQGSLGLEVGGRPLREPTIGAGRASNFDLSSVGGYAASRFFTAMSCAQSAEGV